MHAPIHSPALLLLIAILHWPTLAVERLIWLLGRQDDLHDEFTFCPDASGSHHVVIRMGTGM